MECGNSSVDIEDIFGSGDVGPNCVEDGLKASVFSGIGVIALLLLAVLVLVIIVCCLASRLRKIKRKTRVAFFANSDLAHEITDVESNSNTLTVMVVEEEAAKEVEAAANTLKQEKRVGEGSEPEAPTATEGQGNDEIDDDEYATVQEKGAQLLASSNCSEDIESVTKVQREEEASVSYAYIGEDSYLMSASGEVHTEDGEEAETALPDEKYSKITSSVGVKILEGNCGELRHLTDDAPPPSITAAVDVSLLYAKVNKEKKTGKNEDKGVTKDGDYREGSSSHQASERHSNGGDVSQSENNHSSMETPRSLTTTENVASMEAIVASMQNSLKDKQPGSADTVRGRGTSVEEATPEGSGEGGGEMRASGDTAVKIEMENGYHRVETDAQGVDDDSLYVNIDL